MTVRFAIASFSLFLLAGCNSPAQLAPGTFAMCIAANVSDHGDVIAQSKDATDIVISDSGRVVAEWLPVAGKSKASQQLMEPHDFIIRERNGSTEILIVHGKFDLTEAHIKQAQFQGETDPADGLPCVNVTTNSSGSSLLRQLTSTNSPNNADNHSRTAAMVIRGQVFALPSIEDVVHSRFIICTTSSDQAKNVAGILNGTVQ